MIQSALERTLAYQMRGCGLPKPKTGYKFHDTRKWEFDFAWPEIMFAVEVEGGTYHGKSRHTTPTGYRGDLEKYTEANALGWTLFRFDSKHVNSGHAVARIEDFFKSRGCVK